MSSPACPEWTRRAGAASDDPRFPIATGIVRVARGYMGTGGIEHWRIARQAAGDAPRIANG